MKCRWMVLALAALAVFVLPAAARASGPLDLVDLQNAYNYALSVDPTLPAPPTDGSGFAVGGFQGSDPNTPNVGFSAHFDGQGNVIGHVSETVAGPNLTKVQIRYDVVCLSIVGNSAAMGLVVTQSQTNTYPIGAERILGVTDSGVPGGAGDTYAFYTGPSASSCNAVAEHGVFPITKGNINVHD